MTRGAGSEPRPVPAECCGRQETEDHRREAARPEPSDEHDGGTAVPGTRHADRDGSHSNDGQAEQRVQEDAPVDELQTVHEQAGPEHEPHRQCEDLSDELGEIGDLLVIVTETGTEREAGHEGGDEIVDVCLLGDKAKVSGRPMARSRIGSPACPARTGWYHLDTWQNIAIMGSWQLQFIEAI